MNCEEFEELFSFHECSSPNGLHSPLSSNARTNSCVNTSQKSDLGSSTGKREASKPPPTLTLDPEIEKKLYDYQKEGIEWMYLRHCKGRGCLLADEMGLGKTVQVSAFLGAMYRNKLVTSTILIVPPTLIPMWEKALLEWGGLQPPLLEVLRGECDKRTQRLQRLRHGVPCFFIATYGMLRQDGVIMSAQMVDYVVMDEAHLIKNASTRVFKSAMSLSARHRVAITGTPLMNNFEDLWGIFQFVDGAILGSSRAEFRRTNAILLRGNERDAAGRERAAASQQLALIQMAIRPYMLRRGKQQLESVSAAKRDLIIWLQLDDTQKRMYTSLSNGDSEKQVAQNSAACEPFLLLTSLMQTCNHPWLNLDDETYRGSIQNPFQHPEGGPELGNVFSSSKIAAGIALVVKCISENRKVLVFSRSKRMLDLFGVTLMNWLIDFMRVDGDTAPEERLDIVSQFSEKNNIWVLLLTTQVGGIGLTATAASGVVLLDPSWNPSIDAQAVDRVHRVGQTRDVVVYRLITCGTVEEKIYRNQIFKSMAAKQGTAGAEGVGEGGSVEFHRYFTRLQLRNIVDIGVLDHSETAIHLRCLNPDSVLETERSSLLSLPFVCDVSDNGCILVRSTDDDENDEEGVNIRSVEPCGGSLCQYHGDKALRPVKRFRPECSDQDGLSEYF